MKKILLTLGLVAVVATPLITVVACQEASGLPSYGKASVEDEHLTITGFKEPHYVENATEENIEKSRVIYFNELGNVLSKAAAGKNITKVTLDGELIAEDSQREEVVATLDFINVESFSTLDQYIKTFSENTSGANAASQVIANIFEGMIEDTKPGQGTEAETSSALKVHIGNQYIDTTFTKGAFKDETINSSSEAFEKIGILEEDFYGIKYIIGHFYNGYIFTSATTEAGIDSINFNFQHITSKNNYTAVISNRLSFDGAPSAEEAQEASSIDNELESLSLTSSLLSTEDLSSATANNEVEAMDNFGLDNIEYDKILGELTDGWIFDGLEQNPGELGTIKVNYFYGYTQTSYSTIIPDTNIRWADE